MKKIVYFLTISLLFTIGCQTQSSNNNINIKLDDKLINKLKESDSETKKEEGKSLPDKSVEEKDTTTSNKTSESSTSEKVTESSPTEKVTEIAQKSESPYWTVEQVKDYKSRCTNIIKTNYPVLINFENSIDAYCTCGLKGTVSLHEKYTPSQMYSAILTQSDLNLISVVDSKCTEEHLAPLFY